MREGVGTFRILECMEDDGSTFFIAQEKGFLWGWNDLQKYNWAGGSTARFKTMEDARKFIYITKHQIQGPKVVWDGK